MTQTHNDHEVLLLLRQEVHQLNTQLQQTLGQLKEGNTRFEQIARDHSNFDARIERMIQPIARAGLESQRALELARLARDAVKELTEDLYGKKEEDRTGIVQEVRRNSRSIDEWKYYIKVAAAVFTILQLLIMPLLIALLQRYVGL